MILFHFTAISLLDAILREGLTRGEIPFSQTELGRAVWFTTDPSPAGHGLTDGGPVAPETIAYLERQHGQKLPTDLSWPDKRRVRIEVIVPSRDRFLKPWLPFARKHLEREWMNTLTDAGGGKSKAESWYIYQGIIEPERFKSVCIRCEDGGFRPMTEADREEMRRCAAKEQ